MLGICILDDVLGKGSNMYGPSASQVLLDEPLATICGWLSPIDFWTFGEKYTSINFDQGRPMSVHSAPQKTLW